MASVHPGPPQPVSDASSSFPPAVGSNIDSSTQVDSATNDVCLDASKYSTETILQYRSHNHHIFHQLFFENVRLKELNRIFSITRGNLYPNKDMRVSAASVMTWRKMTREEQEAHRERAATRTNREKRTRSRETVRASATSQTARSVTPALESEAEEADLAPMNTRMLSLADSEGLREDFVKELEGQQSAPAAKHLVGKPPRTIAQQNDGLVMRLKRSLLQTFQRLKDTMIPTTTLARAAHPQQHALLVIINEVADPNLGGGPVPLKEVRRKKPQMIVCCDSKSNVKHIVNKLISGFSRDSIAHDKYEHVRIFDGDDLSSVIQSWDRGRETFQVPSLTDTVDRFVERGQICPRSNSV